MNNWLGQFFERVTPADVINLLALIIAGIGVWFVARQLHGLERQTRLQNFAEYTRRYQQIVLNFPEDINSPSFVLGKPGTEKYDNVMRYMRAYFDLCFEEWYLHRQGLIETDFWNIWYDGIETAVSKPSFQQAWRVMKADTNYGPEFSSFIDRRMPQQGAAAAS